MEELSYTSKFDGETTDDILGYPNEGKTEKVNEYVKSMNVQDSEGEPDTVQVYDTDGVPHKVSKTELLKKRGGAIRPAFLFIKQQGRKQR